MEPRTLLVLVHGSRLGHTQWAPQVPLLGEEFDLLRPDLPGHGSRVGEPFTLDRAVGALAEAIDGPRRGRPPGKVILVGHSLGGYAAMAYAGLFPRRLDGLVLIGSAAVPVGLGAAAYRAVGSLTERVGPDRMAGSTTGPCAGSTRPTSSTPSSRAATSSTRRLPPGVR